MMDTQRLWKMLLVSVCVMQFGSTAGLASEPLLQQAQEILQAQGYDPGATDGILSLRTRVALLAFQRARQLAVTGVLDNPTLEALGLPLLAEGESIAPPPLSPPMAPLQPVLEYLRYYEDQPARLLPYVTERFRGGMQPLIWTEQTLITIAARGFSRLSWKIHDIDMTDIQATVRLHTRFQVDGREVTHQEVFSLVRTSEGAWLIDDWHFE